MLPDGAMTPTSIAADVGARSVGGATVTEQFPAPRRHVGGNSATTDTSPASMVTGLSAMCIGVVITTRRRASRMSDAAATWRAVTARLPFRCRVTTSRIAYTVPHGQEGWQEIGAQGGSTSLAVVFAELTSVPARGFVARPAELHGLGRRGDPVARAAGCLRGQRLKQAVTGLFATPARLGADLAVLVHSGVPLALVPARPTGRRAGLELGSD